MEISRGSDWKVQRMIFTQQGSPKAFVYADENDTWRWFISGEYAGGDAASLDEAMRAVEKHFGMVQEGVQRG